MRKFCLPLFAAFALAGCATHPCSTQPATRSTPPPAPYTRVAHPDTNTVQLQIAIRKFVPQNHRGPAIWLAGTMHVGEPDYYRAVQKFLDGQTVVLYEGVNAGAHKNHVVNSNAVEMEPPAAPSAPVDSKVGSSMQSALADSLGLVFQLDAIDYDRTNFLNSDLSISEIQRLMATNASQPTAPGQPAQRNQTFDALLQIMDGSSFLGSLFKIGIQFIGSDPKFQAITKLTLIEAIGRLNGDFSGIHGLPPDLKQLLQVLIEARNQHVVGDLKTELKTIPRNGSIAVFYGTGHMDDMEKRLTSELHYRPADEIWFTAFSVDLHRAGLSPLEVQLMRNLVKYQLDQMQ